MKKKCMPPVKRYMTAIERRLCMDAKTRVRIMNDLSSDFQNRRDAGLTDEQIMAELGAPDQVAAEFNAAFAGEPAPRKSPWRWLLLALAAAVPAALLLALPALPDGREAAGIGIIGGADGPTAIFVTSAVNWSVIRSVFAWGVGFASAFLLLGWCRARRQRLWLPLLLCGAVTLWQLAVRILQMGTLISLGLGFGAALAGALRDFALSGGLLCAIVLVWSLRCRRR